ncbi:MAG: DUF4352 domain-containing protein [Dictyoglomus turgidum]|uniref:DUF4352 domain-containing protein n=1 Tax=Dictyoglomus turgidum TaxID=513050 RepID=UPI003C72C55E
MKKGVILIIIWLLFFSLSFGETTPLIIQGKEVKGENLDGLIVYILKVQKIEELPLYLDFKYLPEGIFYMVNLFIWNKTEKEILLTHNNFSLIDDDGRKNPVSTFASVYYALRDYNVFFKKYIKPGELMEGYLIFEINKSNTPYKLNIVDIPEKGKSYTVSLNL